MLMDEYLLGSLLSIRQYQIDLKYIATCLERFCRLSLLNGLGGC